MGGFFAKALHKILSPKERKILMVGLDAAGKTTIVWKLKLPLIQPIPTIGFDVETFEYKNLKFTAWDVGGGEDIDKIRPLWRHYYRDADGVIFVVDSSDRERIDGSSESDNSAKEELHRMLAEDDLQLRDVVLLVLANKQDLPDVMSVDEVTERLGLISLEDCQWHIQSTCATTGDGLFDGLDWLSNTLNKRR